MSFFLGFANEFGRQLQQSRADEAQRAEAQDQLQAGILQHLATSPDPEIQAHAISGLLDLAGPRKYAKGFGGLLGKMAENPALPTIRELIAHGRQVEVPAHVPQAQVQTGLPAELPGERLSATGAPLADAQPFTPAATPPPAFQPGDVYQPPRTITVPRQVFDTPEAAAGKLAEAQTAGQFRGRLGVLRGGPGQAPLTPEEQEILFPGRALTTAGTLQGKQAPAGSLDNTGRPLDPEGYYTAKADPRNPGKTVYFPSIPPASVTNQAAIASRYQITHYVGPDGKTPGAWRVSRDGSKPPQFIGYLPAKGQYLQYVDPDTQQVSYIAAPPVYMAGAPLTPSSQPPGAPPAVTAPAGAAAAGPPAVGGVVGAGGATGAGAAAPGAPGVAGGPAAAAPPAPGQAGAAPAGSARAAGGGVPARGIAGGRKRQLEPVKGAVIGPDGTPQVAQAFLDKGTGQYYSATDPSQPATGFIPGDEGNYAVQAYAQANNTLITVAAAKKAIEDAGLTTDNNPQHTLALMSRFYSGTTGGDPIAAAVASLTNLAGIQGATQYIRSNSRSYQMFQAALQHLPNAPTQRVAAMSQLPVVGKVVTPENAMLAGSHGWDSFQSMYNKLSQAEAIIQEGKQSLAELTGKTADRAVGGMLPGQGRSATGAPLPTIGERRLINGILARWDGIGWKPVAAAAGSIAGGRGGRR